MQKITPCLWFDHQAEEAARFYTSIFKNSRIGRVVRTGKGSVLTVTFRLDSQEFLALNGGPQFKFTEAVSFIVNCGTQQEVDRMWKKLSEGGEEVHCGWLKDKYGMSWQIVPAVLGRMLGDPDPARSERVLQAVLGMKKLDLKGLKRAYGRR